MRRDEQQFSSFYIMMTGSLADSSGTFIGKYWTDVAAMSVRNASDLQEAVTEARRTALRQHSKAVSLTVESLTIVEIKPPCTR